MSCVALTDDEALLTDDEACVFRDFGLIRETLRTLYTGLSWLGYRRSPLGVPFLRRDLPVLAGSALVY